MSNLLIRKEWESQFFNQSIYDLNFDQINSDLVDCPAGSIITTKVNAQDYAKINSLNTLGFTYCEGDACFERNIKSQHSINEPSINEWLADCSSLSELKKMIPGLYVSSRFREPWFTTEQRDDFYQTWLENAVFATFDDCCLIIKDKHTIIGFVTVKICDSVASIGLIGVHKEHHGKGVGKNLLDLVHRYCIKKHVIKIKVATQISNIAAINLYTKNDFKLSEISHWFYKKAPA